MRPFLLARGKLSPLQVWRWRVDVTRALLYFKAALPLAQRVVVLEQKLADPRSLGHAEALEGLCVVYLGLKDFVAANKTIKEALAIMEELSLQRHEDYGSMLVLLGRLDFEQGRYKEALFIYDKAQAVLAQYKEGNEYGVLLNAMAHCHQRLYQWNEAVACFKEDAERARKFGLDHPNYAVALVNLADLFAQLKQYEEAIPRYEEALIIYQRVFGDQHERSVFLARSCCCPPTRFASRSCQDRCGPRTLHVQPVRQGQGEDGVVHWMPPCMVLRQGVPAAALGHAQAAVQCLSALRCGADQDQALLALSQGEVLRCRVQQGPLERAQKGLRRAVQQVASEWGMLGGTGFSRLSPSQAC